MFFFKKKEKSLYEYPVVIEEDEKKHTFSLYRVVNKKKVGVTYDISCDFDTYVKGIEQIKQILLNWERNVKYTREELGLSGNDAILECFQLINISNMHLYLNLIRDKYMAKTESWILFKRHVLFPMDMLVDPKVVALGKYKFVTSLLSTCQSQLLTTVIPEIDPEKMSDVTNPSLDSHDLVIGQVIDERNLNGVLDLMILYSWAWLIPLHKYYDPNVPRGVFNLAV